MQLSEWLSSSTAKDIMVRDLVTLSPDQSLAEAADILYCKQISGAPVVNDRGQCVGICTASDILLRGTQGLPGASRIGDFRVLDVRPGVARQHLCGKTCRNPR